MAKKYNTRLIKIRESYNSKQASELLNTHIKTVQRWVQQGLPVITNKPILIMGYDLKMFLDKKQQDRKCKLEPSEFYCTKCRKAVKSVNNEVRLDLTGKTIGKKTHRELVIKGVCSNCATKINRFSHEGKLQEIQKTFNVTNIEEICHGK